MTDPRSVFEEMVPARLAAHPELADQLDAVLQVDIAGPEGGSWSIDLRRDHAPARVDPGPHSEARVRIEITAADFRNLLAGRRRWTDAFVQGGIRFDGDLVTALKLRKLLATSTAASGSGGAG